MHVAAGEAGRKGRLPRAARSAGEPPPRLTNPDRKLFNDPPISKRALADFYGHLAERMLPEIRRRPLSFIRCPQSIEQACFFQRHLGRGSPDSIHPVELAPPGKRQPPYLYIEDRRGLMGLVQMGVVEIHAWGATIDHVEQPDRLVLDLDPGDGVPWREVVATALLLRKKLATRKLESFVRTSGGKGLHVVAPLAPAAGWDEVKAFARDLAQELERESPERHVATAAKDQRQGRIYIDYLRNGRGASAICSYSLRARPGAPVATPIGWDELPRLRSPQQFTYRNLARRLARLRREPWAGIERLRQSLP